MARASKTKRLATRLPLRKSALSATPASRRPFPAWIDAAERVATFSAGAQSRVRDGLVLRKVGRKRSGPKEPTHGRDAR